MIFHVSINKKISYRAPGQSVHQTGPLAAFAEPEFILHKLSFFDWPVLT